MYQLTTATRKVSQLTNRIRAVAGGTSASKTVSVLLFLISLAQSDTTPTLTSVVSESFPHLKRGAIRDFLNILETHRYFKWDDPNNSSAPTGWTEYSGDAPIVVRDLDAATLQYTVATADFLQILEVAVKKTDGSWHVLSSMDRNKGTAQELADLEASAGGLPARYDKIGQYLRLDRKPGSSQVTLSGGLRITFQRNPSYFAAADTTKAPGFATPFHRILSVGASIDFCIANGWSKKKKDLEDELKALHEGLVAHYSARSKDEQTRLDLQHEDYGGASLTGRGVREDRFDV